MEESSTPGADRMQHWDAAYEGRGSTGVSWYQPTPKISIELVELLKVSEDAAVIDIGGGASLFVDALVARGFRDLSVLDVSKLALETVGQRLGSAPVSLLHEDLLAWSPQRRFGLWHDRAVFHFLVQESDQELYLEVLRSALLPGGGVIMATFASDGPEFCSGLPVARYSSTQLAKVLGVGFEVVDERREEHVTPAGATQRFTWIAARAR